MSSRPQTAYELLTQQPDGLCLVFDDFPIGIIFTDRCGTAVVCNREARRIFGACGGCTPGADPLPSCCGAEMYLPDKKTRYSPGEAPLARALRGEEVMNELVFVRNNNTPRGGVWIRTNSRPMKDASGNLCGAVAAFFDVTELRHAAEQMNLLSLAVDQTADSVVITDRHGIIQYVNPAFESTTGYSRQEALGRTPAILKSGRHDASFYAAMWETILGGATFRGTLVNRKKNGELYHAEQTIAPIRNSEGAMTHFVSVLKDVTALRKQQEQAIELELAREVQERLHASATSIPGLDMGAVMLPAAETGGDYFDSIPGSRESLTVAVGDVSGHGFYAALGMALTRAYVRSACDHGLEIAATLASINNMLCLDLDDDHYVTLVLVRIDLAARRLTYASAGHISALLFDPHGGVEELHSTDVPLGIFKDHTFTCRTMPIREGQTLVMVTDGVTESGGDPGIEWIIDYVRSNSGICARELADGLCGAAVARTRDDVRRDDMTALVVKVET